MATVAFGQDDEVVAESFGANDELVEGFGQDDEVVKTPEQSDMSEQMAQAGKSGEFWEKVGNALQWIETNAIEPLTRPVSGVVGRALDVVPGIQAEERLRQPLLPLPRAGQAETPAGQIAAGGVNAVADLAEGFSSPDMLAQLPAGVNKLVLATWSALLAKHAPEQFGEAVRLKQEGDLQGAARAAFTGAGEGLMSALIARHAAGPKAEAIPERPVESIRTEPEPIEPPAPKLPEQITKDRSGLQDDIKMSSEIIKELRSKIQSSELVEKAKAISSQREPANLNQLFAIAKDFYERIGQLENTTEAQRVRSKLMRTIVERPNEASGENLANLLGLKYDPTTSRMPSRYQFVGEPEVIFKEPIAKGSIEHQQLEPKLQQQDARAFDRILQELRDEQKPTITTEPSESITPNPVVPNAPSTGPTTGPSMQLGIAPGANAFQKIVDYFKPPKDEAVPEMVVDTGTSLPDLQPKDISNQVFSKPFGVEKIPVLGRLFGGRARIRTPRDQAVAAWFAERHGVGPAVASSVGQELGGRVNQVFKVDAEGNLNVAPMKQGASRKISDVFEHLDDYVLTPEQQAVYESSIKPLLDRYHELTDKYDLLPHELEGDYFPRIVTERPQESAATLAGGKRVGAKQRFQKERAFETEAEGWERGYKYETDVEKRLVTGVEQLYRAVADRRLADDPVLDGKTRQGLIAELKEAYAEELGSGEMTEAKIDRIADGLQATGTVWQPGFFGKIFDSETANMLNKEFGREQSSIRRTLANANDFIKALALGFDVGVGQIQLLPTAFRNPAIWAKAQATSIGNMFKPEVWKAFAEANRTEIRELAQHGSSVGRLPEMVSGLSSGVIKSIPGLREAAKPFARQFQSALDVAKVELWKAWRDITPREEHQQLVQSIESMLLNARMESSMVPHGRALAERVLLLAPSYYRGAINLVSSLGDKGVSGRVARQSIGSFMAGSVALYYAVGLASGMDIEDLNKRMDPSRSDFMLWDVEAGGQKMNIGIGGIFRSFIRLAGNMVKTSIETPGNWASLSSEKNPLSRWYRGHAGPTVGIAWDQISGKDFLGTPVSIKDVPQKVAPLWMQDMVQAQGNPEKGLVTVPAQFAGLTTIPATKDQKPHYFQLKDKIRSRVGFEEYLNSVARQARLMKPDKRRAYIAKRIKDDEVAPKYRNEAKRKLLMKMRQ